MISKIMRMMTMVICVYVVLIDDVASQVESSRQVCFAPRGVCEVFSGTFGVPCICSLGQNAESGRAGPRSSPELEGILRWNSDVDFGRFSFEYFRKQIDEDRIMNVFSQLKIDVTLKTPVRTDVLTDAIIFSRDVPPELVRFIAVALLRGGVPIRAIIRYGENPDRPLPPRVRLVQLGTAGISGVRVLTEAELLNSPLPLVKRN